MKRIAILILLLLSFISCDYNTTNNNPNELVKIKSHTSKKHGNGINLVAEVENLADKKISFVSAEFTWYDKNGNILDSGTGTCRDIETKGTGVIDRYFDKQPEGSTYKIKIKKVT
ncbi:hypothetical protein ES705_35193 [subsurface metagenome]